MILQLKIITIITLFCLLNFTIIGNYYGLVSIYGQGNDPDNTKNIPELNNDSENQIKVEDIKFLKKNLAMEDPVLLIMGYSSYKNDWDPIFLKNYLPIIQS